MFKLFHDGKIWTIPNVMSFFRLLLVPIISFLFFKKNNTWLVWLAVLIGVCGMYLLCMTEGFRLTR